MKQSSGTKPSNKPKSTSENADSSGAPVTPHATDADAAGMMWQQERARWRFWLIAMGIGLVVTLICLQLLRYQVVGGGERAHYSQPKDPAPRGVVVDARGTPLVVNRYFYQITATPSNLRTQAQRERVADELFQTLGLPYAETLENLTTNAERMFTILADAVSPEDTRRLLDMQADQLQNEGSTPLQQVHAKPMARRFYPQGTLTAHTVGFVRPDYGGITGVEEYYEQFLRADGPGLLSTERSALEALAPHVQRFLPSEVGKDLVLSMDRTIQWIAHEELARGLDEYGAQAGSIIILEPKTGAILAMVNLPDYDPNRYQLAEIERFPNPAISAQYEPGSVFKIITFGAGIDLAHLDSSTVFTDTGIHVIGGRTIFNSNRVGHGQVDATDALARSLNVVTAQVAEILGPEDFYQYVRLFGFGEAAGIDLPDEIAGAVKTPNSPDWSLSDLGTNSFGQGLAVTPLQMANATAAIANGGILMRPYLVQARVTNGEVQTTEPTTMRRVLSADAAALLSDMMVDVLENGSPQARVPGYQIAGKSGTAQIPTPEGYIDRETIVSFVGFAPAHEPAFAILVKMDRPDPEIGIWAGDTAAPVFSRIATRLLDYMQIAPDDIRTAQFTGQAGE